MDQPAIGPGECLDDFVIESDFLPGFLLAAFRGLVVHYAPDRMSWPEKVLKQAADLEERDWFEKYFLTIGPTIPPDQSKRTTAAAVLKGIEELVGQERIRSDSPFIRELIEWLEIRSQTEVSTSLDLESEPLDGPEREIWVALRLSFPTER